jgi:hypothetical protein
VQMPSGSISITQMVASPCMKPAQNYQVVLYSLTGVVLTRRQWNVPSSGGTVDVSQVDIAER